jgi:hypothetical protein
MDLREVTMKFGPLVIFIRHDSAAIWGFWYGLTLRIGSPKIMASAGVFVRVEFEVSNASFGIFSQT